MSESLSTAGYELRCYGTMGELGEQATEYLMQREAENHFLLGTLGDSPPSQSAIGLTIHRRGQVVACALAPPDKNLLLSRVGPELAEDIARELRRQGIELPGVLAPEADGDAFARAWAELTDATVSYSARLGLYELEQVTPPQHPAPGELVQAGSEHLDRLEAWMEEFGRQVNNPDNDPRAIVEAQLAAGGLYLWHHDRPVTMATYTGRTPSGVRILRVYTPEPLRGHGYASSCVAALSQLLLDRGMTKLFLNTEMSNPTSNSIYQRIGYQRVAIAVEHRF